MFSANATLSLNPEEEIFAITMTGLNVLKKSSSEETFTEEIKE